MTFPFWRPKTQMTSRLAGVATALALLALLIASVAVSPSALAMRSPGPQGVGGRSLRDPHTLAQQRAQQIQQLTPAQRKAALAKIAKLPTWKPNARIVTAKGTASSRISNARSPHLAVPVTTDPNNWTALGPGPVNVGGVLQTGGVISLATSAAHTNDIWLAEAYGPGIWRSTDGGASWTVLTDFLVSQHPGALLNLVAVDPTDDSVVFVPGDSAGLFKSIDGGVTWQSTGATLASVFINKFAISAANDQIMLAAGIGAAGGVWRSTNGGATWVQTLTDNSTTPDAGMDVVFDTAHPGVAYCALGGDSSGSSSAGGVYRSTDNGATWSLLGSGPTGTQVGKIALGLAHDGAQLYVSAEDLSSGQLFNSSLYVFDAATSMWSTHDLSSTVVDTFGWTYNNVIAAAPSDSTDQTVYLGSTSLFRSTDGGVTWSKVSTGAVGSGMEALSFPSASSGDFVLATDQGMWSYTSSTWTDDNATLPIAYADPGSTYGDQGPDSPFMAQSAPGLVQYPAGASGLAQWIPVAAPNVGTPETIDWASNANVYAGSVDCSSTCTPKVYKSTSGGTGPYSLTGFSTTDFGFGTQPVMSQVQSQTLFEGATRLWKTSNGGSTWVPVSPQLDKPAGCTGPSDSNCPYIWYVTVAPSTDSTMLVQYVDGQVYTTTDGGTTWYSVPLPCNLGGCVAISPANPQVMYAAGNVNDDGRIAPHSGCCGAPTGIYISNNAGHSWSLLPGWQNLPYSGSSGAYLTISPSNPNLLALSTGFGFDVVSFDDGYDWSSINIGPLASYSPVTFSHDGSQLLLGTGSRGIYALAMPHLTVAPQTVTLTTDPGSSPADQSVTLGNSGQGALRWSTSGLPSWLHVSPSSGSIPAGGSTNVTLSFTTTSMTPQTYATQLDFHTNADNPLTTLPVTVSSSWAKTWYFAEGYTGGSFTEYLTLANPNPTTATVSVQYLLQGLPPVTKTYTVSANARKTLNVNTELGQGIGVSMVVTSDLPIVAERPMYFTFTGAGLNVPGGTDVLGATNLGTQFDFGYLDTTAHHATYLTVLNPSGSSMDVTVNYYAAAGGSPTTVHHSVPANSRGTILVNSDVSAGSYSALVTLSTNGLVERPMYLTDATTGYTGSADVIGVQQPTTRWSFAEGYTSPTFTERYILSNPTTGSTTAHATVTFYKGDGTTATANVTLTPGQQQVVSANSVLGSGVNNSATVTSDQPILAERFMSFTYTGPVGVNGSGNIPGATDVLGASSVGTVYAFAEGYTGGSFGEYLTLQNPQNTTTAVTVVYLPQTGGSPTIQTYFVAAHSRYTILTNRVLVNQSFSMLVLADQPIVAERPMYFNYNSGQTGGSDVLGYQP